MIRIPKVTMSMRELDRLKCIQGLIDGQLKQTAVAVRLGLTTRQVRRLVRRYEQQGPIGLISRLRDRPSNRRLKSDAAEHAFGILRSTYADFGPTLAAEEAQSATAWIWRSRPSDPHGRRRPMGAAKASGAEDSTTPEPPRVPRRARRVAAKFGCPLDSEPADTITTLISGEHPASAHLAPGATCTMMPHAHSGTVQSLSHRDVLQRPRASALSHRHDK